MEGVMKAVNEGDFQEMVLQQTGIGGLPLMTPRKYEVQGAAQRSAAQDGGRRLGGVRGDESSGGVNRESGLEVTVRKLRCSGSGW